MGAPRRLIVIGGGRAGTFHARQLLKAVRGGLEATVVVVDHDDACLARVQLPPDPRVVFVQADWLQFLGGWLAGGPAEDQLVPAPVAPHLIWEWLRGQVGAAPAAAPRGWGLPFEVPGEGGELYLSAAAWICPATCIEPAWCPILHGPRDWDLGDLIEDRARRERLEPAVFRCLHFAAGVGTIPARALLEARDHLLATGTGGVLVATSSRCHAAVGAMVL